MSGDVVTYTDTTIADGVTYDYRVRAYDNTGHSGYSGVASFTTSAETDGGAIYTEDTKIGYINPYTDTDEYTFNGTKYHKVTITMVAEYDNENKLNPSIQLIGPDGTEETYVYRDHYGSQANWSGGYSSDKTSRITDCLLYTSDAADE